MEAKPYEVISTEDKEQFPTQHGSTLQAYELTAKNQAGEALLIRVNRKPSNPPPGVGETIWLETYETEFGLKGKRMQGPRGPARTAPAGGDDRDRSIVRQHSQHMALQFAALQGGLPPDPGSALNQIEAWTDHFDADVQRVSGAAQGNGSPITAGARDSAPASPQAPNGDTRKISQAQITGFILRLQKQRGISDENMALLVKSFGVDRLKDLPMSQVDRFAKAMADPIPDGSSDVPVEPEPPAASADDEALPF